MPESIVMPLAEVCDRYTIAVLKLARLGPEQRSEDEAVAQVDYYARGVDWKNPGLCDLVMKLTEINGLIWDTEAAIRAGQERHMTLEEVGREALKVRDLNRQRNAVKNQIVELTNSGFKDVKMNYAGG